MEIETIKKSQGETESANLWSVQVSQSGASQCGRKVYIFLTLFSTSFLEINIFLLSCMFCLLYLTIEHVCSFHQWLYQFVPFCQYDHQIFGSNVRNFLPCFSRTLYFPYKFLSLLLCTIVKYLYHFITILWTKCYKHAN